MSLHSSNVTVDAVYITAHTKKGLIHKHKIFIQIYSIEELALKRNGTCNFESFNPRAMM